MLWEESPSADEEERTEDSPPSVGEEEWKDLPPSMAVGGFVGRAYKSAHTHINLVSFCHKANWL